MIEVQSAGHKFHACRNWKNSTYCRRSKKNNIRSKVPILFLNYRCIIAVCLAMLQLQFNVAPLTVKRRFSTRWIEFWTKPQSSLGCPDHRLLFRYVCRELSKRVLLQTFQEESTWLNRLREKQWSVIQRTSKYVTVRHARHRWGTYWMYFIYKPCSWKEKLALLMLPRFQGSLQRTKSLILNLSEQFTKASVLVTHWNIFKISWTLSGR